MARILRGEVRWADLNPVRGRAQPGQRPVLVLSHDVFNERSGTVIAVAMTSQEPRAGFPAGSGRSPSTESVLDLRGPAKKNSLACVMA